MKNPSSKEIYAISAIIIIFIVLGVRGGLALLESLKPMLNLAKIAFAGFISFAIVGVIMAIGNAIGIWFGKLGGSILYAITLYIVSSLIF